MLTCKAKRAICLHCELSGGITVHCTCNRVLSFPHVGRQFVLSFFVVCFQFCMIFSWIVLKTHSNFFLFTVLYFCASVFMVVSVTAVVLLYIFYTRHEECIANKLFIIINASLCTAMCVMSILPCTRRSEFRFSWYFRNSLFCSICFLVDFLANSLTILWSWLKYAENVSRLISCLSVFHIWEFDKTATHIRKSIRHLHKAYSFS